MVTKRLACPSCGVGLRVAGDMPAGKRIRCPKCGEPFAVPASARPKPPPVEVDENPFEVVDEPDEREERPAPQRPARPRGTRPKKKAKSNTPMIVGIAAAVGILLVGGVTLAVVYWPGGNKSDAVAANTTPGATTGADHSAQGQQVFRTNCARCHPLGGAAGGKGKARGPDLTGTGRDAAHTVEWFMAFIRDPAAVKPNAGMPAFPAERISDADLRALAEYLKTLK